MPSAVDSNSKTRRKKRGTVVLSKVSTPVRFGLTSTLCVYASTCMQAY